MNACSLGYYRVTRRLLTGFRIILGLKEDGGDEKQVNLSSTPQPFCSSAPPLPNTSTLTANA
ncbi:hypothetical protein [Coleofasciculus sp. LEGE 07092]|uniref:hypothetical protein n=1 Tax=Coleofasciculus sp. LEGE 07092 TaxID=2777969 RepID=UPI001882306F|nr:hypothetical protein [Coleofasciculus sp. LEGE 07092]MBE9148255.1 hypothetical protein [Coleofasciculus sp. LEGE 07092]